MKALLLLALSLAVNIPAAAHPLDLAYAQLRTDGSALTVTLDVHPGIARRWLQQGGMPNADPLLPTSHSLLFRESLGRSRLSTERGDCRWTSSVVESLAQSVRVRAQATCPDSFSSLWWKIGFLQGMPSTYQVLGRASLGGGQTETVFTADRNQSTVSLAVQGNFSLVDFIGMGIAHIGATPAEWRGPDGWKWPDGIDHILFLIGLILGGTTISEMLMTATGFTFGHSITLALALLGWLRIPGRVVEPAIALTIALVAAEAFLQKQRKGFWKIAALFGLIHGLGFASALADLRLSTRWSFFQALVGFNFGIEIGQAVIVALVAPVFLVLRRWRFFARYGVRACSFGISGTGIYWFFVRLFA